MPRNSQSVLRLRAPTALQAPTPATIHEIGSARDKKSKVTLPGRGWRWGLLAWASCKSMAGATVNASRTARFACNGKAAQLLLQRELRF